MTTIVINENTEEGRSLINVAMSMQKTSDAIISISDEDEVSTASASMRIPGLPYTDEEKIASVRKSMSDVRAGRTVSMEEMRNKHPMA